jgi:hypothetical protein
VAGSPGFDLNDGHAGAGDALGVEIGGLVAFDHRAANRAGSQRGQSLLDQCGLAGSRGADEVEGVGVLSVEQGAVVGRVAVVLGQERLLDLDEPAGAALLGALPARASEASSPCVWPWA